MNEELQALFDADQADRQQLDASVAERDRKRRGRVEELLSAGALHAPEDYFHAAILFQHSDSLEDYWKAHELALKAAEMGDRRGRRLAAMAHDRWLIHQGKPQKYGTQFVSDGKQWRVWDVDPATTDAERDEWNVPPIAQGLQETRGYYGDPTPVDMDSAPQWLKDTLQRWERE